MGHQDQRGVADLADRRKFLEGVEAGIREHMGIDHDGAVETQHQRVAVGRRRLGQAGTDVAGRTRLVVDDDLLPTFVAIAVARSTAAWTSMVAP